jgi:hypothetical protein
VLPGYELGELLGRGSSGEVIAGRHRRLGREVALKRLRPGLGDDPRMTERFLAEARVLAGLDHPHVVRLHDIVEAEGQLVLVMERLTGGTVDARRAAGRMDPAEACATVLATCSGLGYAHARGILHRDVKPQNLLLSADGVLKIADFGIAKLLDGPSAATRTGVVLGTPAYIAPEQVEGETLTPAADVYATGAVLYELLSGALPFPTLGRAVADLHRRVTTDPAPLRRRAPQIPGAVAAVVDRALRRDPADRYATAADLGAALADAARAAWGRSWNTEGAGPRPLATARSAPASRPASVPAPETSDAPEATLVDPAADAAGPSRRDVPGPTVPTGLLERDDERRRLGTVVDAARLGTGGAAVLRGPAGIGKTRLLHAAADLAGDAGVRVLRARGGEMERDFPYGVVRQLLEREVRGPGAEALEGAARLAGPALGLGGAETPHADADREFALCHGLYWLVCDLAAARPLLLVVDDLQHVDPPSLRFLLYLARRLDGLPVGVVAALREGASETDPQTLAALVTEPGVRSVRPAGLRSDGVATLVGDRLGVRPSPSFVSACVEVTGGNPFLLEQLLGAAGEEGLTPDAAGARRVRQLVPEAVTRSVLDRLAREPDQVAALARSVAILGDDVELRHAAELAALDGAVAAAAADRLADLALLREGSPLSFLHPLLRSTVLAGMRPAGRAAAHARAAEILEADGAPLAAVTAHLMEREPSGDARVVALLRAAARTASERGAADIAARHLQRARREPPAPESRGAVLAELGRAASVAGDARTAADALDASVPLATDPVTRVERRLLAFRAHFQLDGSLDPDEILAIIADVDALGDVRETVAPELVGDVLAAGTNVPGLLPRLGGRLAGYADAAGETATERIMFAALSRVACHQGATADDAAAYAERSLGGPVAPEGAEAISRFTALYTLVDADRLQQATEQLEATILVARRRGSLVGYASAVGFRALVAFQCGDVRGAVADAASALETGALHGALHPLVLACLVRARLAEGDVERAAELVAPLEGVAIPDIVVFNHALVARAQVRFARADLDGALADVRLALERVPRAVRCSRVLPWRGIAVPVLLAAGDGDGAATVAAADVAAARRWGTPGAIGAAAAGHALCAPAPTRPDALRDAVATLERSPARLDLAAALLHLGEALTGHDPEEASRTLKRGVELAEECGSHALVLRGQAVRRAAGEPAPDPVRHDTLTPRARRVAGLAARGCSPREIAEALFVTVRVVEDELRAVDGAGLRVTPARTAEGSRGTSPPPREGAGGR